MRCERRFDGAADASNEAGQKTNPRCSQDKDEAGHNPKREFFAAAGYGKGNLGYGVGGEPHKYRYACVLGCHLPGRDLGRDRN